ncbi:MAG: anaphase promoting complex subunit doc1 [Bathelium mastoideum]|nr:MAG: anaphase promoting complex subunit doc1 [Bathelium mastoideum]
MPPSTRRTAQATRVPQSLQSSDFEVPSEEDVLAAEAAERATDHVEIEGDGDGMTEDVAMEDIEAGGVEEDEEPEPDATRPSPGPPYAQLALREISSLASWTVSTSKPGCGVAALRSPSPDTFWQSDGPQPHTVSLHFFKQVAIVALRVHLDFEADESYTPTRMQFLAGTGPHDLQEWAEMRFEQPKGWIDVDFEGVGEPEEGDDDDEVGGGEGKGKEQREGEEDEQAKAQRYWDRRPALRAFLVQVRILENHQNGKDTHVRGLQVYARDRKEPMTSRMTKSAVQARPGASKAPSQKKSSLPGLKEPSWLAEPVFR